MTIVPVRRSSDLGGRVGLDDKILQIGHQARQVRRSRLLDDDLLRVLGFCYRAAEASGSIAIDDIGNADRRREVRVAQLQDEID